MNDLYLSISGFASKICRFLSHIMVSQARARAVENDDPYSVKYLRRIYFCIDTKICDRNHSCQQKREYTQPPPRTRLKVTGRKTRFKNGTGVLHSTLKSRSTQLKVIATIVKKKGQIVSTHEKTGIRCAHRRT